MTKSKETYAKVAATFKHKGDRDWAKTRGGAGGQYYGSARRNYNTAKKALEAAGRTK